MVAVMPGALFQGDEAVFLEQEQGPGFVGGVIGNGNSDALLLRAGGQGDGGADGKYGC